MTGAGLFFFDRRQDLRAKGRKEEWGEAKGEMQRDI